MIFTDLNLLKQGVIKLEARIDLISVGLGGPGAYEWCVNNGHYRQIAREGDIRYCTLHAWEYLRAYNKKDYDYVTHTFKTPNERVWRSKEIGAVYTLNDLKEIYSQFKNKFPKNTSLSLMLTHHRQLEINANKDGHGADIDEWCFKRLN